MNKESGNKKGILWIVILVLAAMMIWSMMGNGLKIGDPRPRTEQQVPPPGWSDPGGAIGSPVNGGEW
jgi:hypothetical protein